MNRTDRIIPCVKSWLRSEVINDCVIVDWSSTPPITENQRIQNLLIESKGKVRIITINNKEFFSQTIAYNIAIENTINDSILKVDVDHIVVDDIFVEALIKCQPKLKKNFYSCRMVTSVHSGIVFFDKEVFNEAGRYNEDFIYWGYDDIDLYNRMGKIAREHILQDVKKYVLHNPHSDEMRTENYQIKEKYEGDAINRMIADKIFDLNHGQ